MFSVVLYYMGGELFCVHVLTDSISGNDCVLNAIFCRLVKADGTSRGTPGADVTSTLIWR